MTVVLVLAYVAGVFGTYRVLSDLMDDDVKAAMIAIFWPLGWPLIGAFAAVWIVTEREEDK